MERCSVFPNVFVFFYYLQNPGNISHKKRKTVQGRNGVTKTLGTPKDDRAGAGGRGGS